MRTHSKLLQQYINTQNPSNVTDACDMNVTAGYDNDGSTGPELLDNGIELERNRYNYNPKATIYSAELEGEDGEPDFIICQYGTDEADAVTRLHKILHNPLTADNNPLSS